jgi:hypothetical protein
MSNERKRLEGDGYTDAELKSIQETGKLSTQLKEIRASLQECIEKASFVTSRMELRTPAKVLGRMPSPAFSETSRYRRPITSPAGKPPPIGARLGRCPPGVHDHVVKEVARAPVIPHLSPQNTDPLSPNYAIEL